MNIQGWKKGVACMKKTRVYLRSQKCWNIRQKAPDARRMSAALLGGMQANATQQMGLFGRIEQRWGIFRYTLRTPNKTEKRSKRQQGRKKPNGYQLCVHIERAGACIDGTRQRFAQQPSGAFQDERNCPPH